MDLRDRNRKSNVIVLWREKRERMEQKKIFEEIMGVPIVVQWLTNPTRNHKVVGLIPGLAQWVKDLALP